MVGVLYRDSDHGLDVSLCGYHSPDDRSQFPLTSSCPEHLETSSIETLESRDVFSERLLTTPAMIRGSGQNGTLRDRTSLPSDRMNPGGPTHVRCKSTDAFVLPDGTISQRGLMSTSSCRLGTGCSIFVRLARAHRRRSVFRAHKIELSCASHGCDFGAERPCSRAARLPEARAHGPSVFRAIDGSHASQTDIARVSWPFAVSSQICRPNGSVSGT